MSHARRGLRRDLPLSRAHLGRSWRSSDPSAACRRIHERRAREGRSRRPARSSASIASLSSRITGSRGCAARRAASAQRGRARLGGEERETDAHTSSKYKSGAVSMSRARSELSGSHRSESGASPSHAWQPATSASARKRMVLPPARQTLLARRRLKWGLNSMAVTLLYKTHELVVRSSACVKEVRVMSDSGSYSSTRRALPLSGAERQRLGPHARSKLLPPLRPSSDAIDEMRADLRELRDGQRSRALVLQMLEVSQARRTPPEQDTVTTTWCAPTSGSRTEAARGGGRGGGRKASPRERQAGRASGVGAPSSCRPWGRASSVGAPRAALRGSGGLPR